MISSVSQTWYLWDASLEEEGLHELASGFEASSPSLKWVLMRSQAPQFPEQGRLGGTEEEQDITGTQQSPNEAREPAQENPSDLVSSWSSELNSGWTHLTHS